jgi:hypothetical protein
MMQAMIPDGPAETTAVRESVDPAHAISYLVTATRDGDLETGAVLLDGRPIGRLRHRRHAPVVSRHPFASSGPVDSAWHAEALGWLPHEGRPWDTRVTSTAPTRLRAAEDLMRAYRNRR